MVGPILEEISNEHGEKLTILKLNVDENPSLAANYGVSSIPTMNVFKGGEVVKQIVGAKPKAKLLEDLADFIAYTGIFRFPGLSPSYTNAAIQDWQFRSLSSVYKGLGC